jgi:hypothetical protein
MCSRVCPFVDSWNRSVINRIHQLSYLRTTWCASFLLKGLECLTRPNTLTREYIRLKSYRQGIILRSNCARYTDPTNHQTFSPRRFRECRSNVTGIKSWADPCRMNDERRNHTYMWSCLSCVRIYEILYNGKISVDHSISSNIERNVYRLFRSIECKLAGMMEGVEILWSRSGQAPLKGTLFFDYGPSSLPLCALSPSLRV